MVGDRGLLYKDERVRCYMSTENADSMERSVIKLLNLLYIIDVITYDYAFSLVNSGQALGTYSFTKRMVYKPL